MSITYFAYGSCMDEIDFKRTVGEFQTLGKATLNDYRLGFTLYGESRSGGVADIIPTAGEEVQGVLFTFADDQLPHLDQREGVHVGHYERVEVDVHFQGQIVRAYTYQVVDKEDTELKPSLSYVQLMLNGMNAHATSEYTQRFKERLKHKFGLEAK